MNKELADFFNYLFTHKQVPANFNQLSQKYPQHLPNLIKSLHKFIDQLG